MGPVTFNLVINKCGECQHFGHSGAFTKGGAKPVCVHPSAANTFTADKKFSTRTAKGMTMSGRVYSYEKPDDDMYHWKHRVVDRDKCPPKQCPIRHGYVY